MNAEQAKEHHRLANSYGAPYGIKLPMPNPYEATWRNRVEGGRLIRYRSLPILDVEQQPIGIVITVSDATDELTASELLSNLFNEMLTPLSFIAGYAQLLQTERVSAEEQREFLQIIGSKAQYLIQVRQELLEAAQKRLRHDPANAS